MFVCVCVQDKLPEIYKEIHSLWQVFSVSPIFGVDFRLEDKVGLAPACGVGHNSRRRTLLLHTLLSHGALFCFVLEHSNVLASFPFCLSLLVADKEGRPAPQGSGTL